MAMGCVPVVMSDVDVEHYAEPLQEGLHYIRVSTPEEVETKVKTISEKQWSFMSNACRAWWSDNASAQGSWRLTSELVKGV
jgi:long-subunit fatty acid transport protein